MGINLVKGENHKLDSSLNRFHIGLGWDVN